MAIELATAYVTILPSTKGLGKSISGQIRGSATPAAAKEGAAAGKSLGSRMAGSIGTAVRRTAKVGIASAGVAAGAALMGGFKSAIDQQNATKTLSGLYGSAKQAQAVMKGLADVSKKSPIDYSAYTKAAQSLAYAGVQGKQATGILKNVGLAITAAGGSSENMGRATDAILKMVNAGKVSLDTLQQLSDAGAPILSGLATKKFGDSTEESMAKISKMATAGKISLNDVLSVMQNATGKTWQQMNRAGKAASTSFSNQWKIAKDNVTRTIGDMMQPLMAKLAPQVGKLGNAITQGLSAIPGKFSQIKLAIWEVRNGMEGLGAADLSRAITGSDALEGVFKALTPAVRSVVGSIKSIGQSAASTLPAFGQMAKALAPLAGSVLKAAIGAIVIAFRALAIILKPIAALLQGIGNFAQAHSTTFRVLAGTILGVVGAYKAMSLAFRAKDAISAAGGLGQMLKNTRLVSGATRIGATVQRGWNAAMALGSKAALGTRIQLAALRVQTLAVAAGQKIAAAASKAYAIAQRLVNAAMRANPIGLIITGLVLLGGALVLAYKKSETFRNIVNAAWSGIKKGLSAAWAVIKPIFAALGSWLGAALPAAGRVLQSVFGAVFGFVKRVVRGWWVILRAIFAAFNGFLRKVIFPVIRFLYRNVFKPIFKAIWTYIRTWWTIIKAVFNAFRFFLTRIIFPVIRFLYRNVIHPMFSAIGRTISNVWHKVISPVFGALRKGVGAVRSAFGSAIGAIKRVWSRLSGYISAPIKKAVDFINKYLIGSINNVAKKLKIPGSGNGLIPSLPVPKGHRAGGYTAKVGENKFAGFVHGKEYVHRAWATRRMDARHPGALEYINKHGRLPGYKAGGFVKPSGRTSMDGKAISRIAKAQILLAAKLSGNKFHMMQGGFGGSGVAASGSSHNYPGVADLSPGTKGAEKWLRKVGFAAWARNIPGRSSVGSGAHVHAVSLLDPADKKSPQVFGSWKRNGNGLGGSNNDPAPHYPLIAGLLKKLGAQNLSLDSLGGGGADPSSAISKITGIVKAIAGKLGKAVVGPVGQLAGGVARKAGSALGSFVKKKIKSAAEKGLGLFSPAYGAYKGIKGVVGKFHGKTYDASFLDKLNSMTNSVARKAYQGYAAGRLKAFGWGTSQMVPLTLLWSKESGWNPHARNPSSGAGGIPQALPASKMGKGWYNNPAQQINWGLRYIKSRYGSPSKAWAHSGRIGWYAGGTRAARRGLAVVGERGPEIVQFRGGETVVPNHQVRTTNRYVPADAKAGKDKTSNLRLVSGEISFRKGKAYLKGLAQEVYDDNAAYAGRTGRMR